MPDFNIALNILSTNTQKIIDGIPQEHLAALVRQHEEHSETQKKLIARLEVALIMNERQIRTALRILGESNVPDEQLGTRIIEIAEQFENLKFNVSADTGGSPLIVTLKADAEIAVDAGELAVADSLFAKTALEQSTNLDRSAISLAKTLGRRAEIALTRLRYGEAAGHFASA